MYARNLKKPPVKQVLFILNESKGFDITRTEKKRLNDFVSYVDKGSEKMLVEKLSRQIPDAGFVTEEEHQKKSV